MQLILVHYNLKKIARIIAATIWIIPYLSVFLINKINPEAYENISNNDPLLAIIIAFVFLFIVIAFLGLVVIFRFYTQKVEPWR